MNNYNVMKGIIASFSGQQNTLTIPTLYIELTGDIQTALLLNQIVFWSDKSKRSDGFFYKTYGEWEQETYLTEYQVRRSVTKLKELGFVETKLKRANGSPTLHYKLEFEMLSDSILKKLKKRNLTNLRNETEETSETLTVDYTDKYTVDLSPHVNKEIKHKFGEFQNVLLLEEEFKKLEERFPTDLDKRIERLSGYIASSGKKYKSHYATIISWARKDAEQPVLVRKRESVAEKLKGLS